MRIKLEEEASPMCGPLSVRNTLRDIVNEALRRRATSRRERLFAKTIDALAKATLIDRADAWR